MVQAELLRSSSEKLKVLHPALSGIPLGEKQGVTPTDSPESFTLALGRLWVIILANTFKSTEIREQHSVVS